MATQSTTKKTPKKKTTPKRAVKKTPTKKAAKRSTPKKKAASARALVCANKDECFWTTDGHIIANLRELESALSAMADEVFSYHVTKEKNDFADWVEHVLHDSACAADLRRSRKPASAQKVVIRHLKLYT